jgi:hypothetical protein
LTSHGFLYQKSGNYRVAKVEAENHRIQSIISNMLWINSRFASKIWPYRFIIHADNPVPHIAEKYLRLYDSNVLRIAPDPPCSSDLASSDFSLFKYFKQCLRQASFDCEEAGFLRIHTVLRAVSRITWAEVFTNWMDILIWVATYEASSGSFILVNLSNPDRSIQFPAVKTFFSRSQTQRTLSDTMKTHQDDMTDSNPCISRM